MKELQTLPPPDPSTDWEQYIRTAVQPRMGETGGGRAHHTVGTIVLMGAYPLKRTLNLSPFQFIQGAWRPGWHLGNSCGFYAADDWEGTGPLVEWDLPRRGSYYSAFGAGMKNLFLDCSDRASTGAIFVGSQQGSLIRNCRIRGFGPGGTGIFVAGDTYRIEDLYVDRDRAGQKTPPEGDGSIGVSTWGQRLDSVTVTNLTVHNCETGLRVGDAAHCSFNLETETTRTPIELGRTSVGCEFNVKATHGDRIMRISNALHGNWGAALKCTLDRTRMAVELPDGSEHLWGSGAPSRSLWANTAYLRKEGGKVVVKDLLP